jgi:hypothetical protein
MGIRDVVAAEAVVRMLRASHEARVGQQAGGSSGSTGQGTASAAAAGLRLLILIADNHNILIAITSLIPSAA